MSKRKPRKPNSNLVSKKCKICGNTVKKVDSDAVSVTCFKCVSKAINPNTRFWDDVSPEELREFIKKH